MPLVCGIDSSTQSTKVEIRDADSGGLMASGRAPHQDTTPPRSEQQPHTWWNALQSALRQAGFARVDAVAVAAQQHGLVVLDGFQEVIRPAKLWNDTESAPQARALVERLGARTWAKTVGSVPVASLTITKLAWLAQNEPDAFHRIRHVLLPHDWLTFRLAGELVTDRGDASGTGYFSARDGRWRTEALELVDPTRDWAHMLPKVLGPVEAAGRWEGAVVGPGTGDNMAAALGIGLQPGDVAISIGTSGTVYTVSDRSPEDPTGSVAGFADATGRFLPLVCTLNATKVSETFARLLGVSRDVFERSALYAPPGAGGLVLVPYLDGERTPNRPDATGHLVGLRGDVTREQVARAVYEGVVCGLLDGLDALAAAGVETGSGRLFLVGGGARSAAFRRVLADLAARPVLVPAGEEHVAAGACVQAAAVLHHKRPEQVAAAWQLGDGDMVEPHPDVDAAAIRAAYAHARG